MAQVTAIVVLVLAGFLGVLGGILVWRRRKRRPAQVAARDAGPRRVPLRSRVIELPQAASQGEREDVIEVPLTAPVLDVHQAPTREFAAHVEALAALTTQGAPTRALAVHDVETRKITRDELLPGPHDPEPSLPAHALTDRVRSGSGIQPRITESPRDRDATLKIGAARARQPARAPTHEVATTSGIMQAKDTASETDGARVRGNRR